MTIHLSIVVFLPVAAALVGALLPARTGRWVAVAGSAATLAYAVALVADFVLGRCEEWLAPTTGATEAAA